METIGQSSLWSFVGASKKIQIVSNTQIRKDNGYPITSYLDLATKVAELQFKNRDYVMLFRGQSGDYHNIRGNTSLKPGLFRGEQSQLKKMSWAELLAYRFNRLRNYEQKLIYFFTKENVTGAKYLKRHRILRWTLLQHYEMCETPLLDVTSSLRIAASFASRNLNDKCYLYVIGVPNLSGAVTASAESGLQIIRLASVCPPSAVRPHIQEGYLIGEYPEMGDIGQKSHYASYEIDFGLRLIAKFYFNPKTFWKKDIFPMVSENALYPNSSDPIYELMQRVKSSNQDDK